MARVGLVRLPRGTTWFQVGLVGVVGGIGFTMALFIAQLAFEDPPHLETAKLAILVASATAALLAYLIGLVVLPAKGAAGGPGNLEKESRS